MEHRTQSLPNNIEAEQAFLGILINDIDILSTVTQYPIPQDFFLERNRIIARTILDLSDKSKQVDIISISETLRANKLLDKVGGPAYLSELTDKGLSSHNIEYYINLIIEKSQRRSIIRYTHAMLERANDESVDITTLLEQGEKDMFEIVDRTKSELYQTAENHFQAFYKHIRERYDNDTPGDYIGIKTNYPMLDKLLSGFHHGDLIIIAARPSIGKTAFALNLINKIAFDDQVPTALFSLEMSGIDIISRLVCMRTGLDGNRIRQNRLNADDIANIMQKMGSKLQTPLYISDISSMNIFDLRIQARRLVAKEKVKIIFVDYLGLIGYENISDNSHKGYLARYEKFSEISRTLKVLARELRIPIVVLSQLNRDSEGKEPILANIRESGAIEQDADVVIMLHRKDRSDTLTKLMIAKQRNGPVGDVEFTFNLKAMLFSEMARQPNF